MEPWNNVQEQTSRGVDKLSIRNADWFCATLFNISTSFCFYAQIMQTGRGEQPNLHPVNINHARGGCFMRVFFLVVNSFFLFRVFIPFLRRQPRNPQSFHSDRCCSVPKLARTHTHDITVALPLSFSLTLFSARFFARQQHAQASRPRLPLP